MGDFYGKIYEILISIFGDNLDSYLAGGCTNFEGGSYGRIGLAITIITIISVLFYYFFFVNSRRNKFKHWFLTMLASGIICGLVAFYLPLADLNKGYVCAQYLFSTEDAIFFGLINILISMLFFFVLSLGVKYIGKADGRYMPFKF
jgi:H+/Cl- antiporter ClcA